MDFEEVVLMNETELTGDELVIRLLESLRKSSKVGARSVNWRGVAAHERKRIVKGTDAVSRVSSRVQHLKLRQIRSTIGCPVTMRATVKALGLRRINDTVIVPNTMSVREALRKVRHLVIVIEL